MYMRLKDGKVKVFTLSYDDGVVQDIRLMQLMDQYGVKGTFNINSGCYVAEERIREKYYGRMKRSEAIALFQNPNHEVALHGYVHAELAQLRGVDLLNEIREDRLAAERDYGRLVRGMAYAFGSYSDEAHAAMRLCGVCYSRTTAGTGKFRFPENWLTWHPTCHHKNPQMPALADKFIRIKLDPTDGPRMFYVWGHSYEFDNDDNWELIEELFQKVGGKEDIWYATNMEIYDYVQAYRSLIVSMDGKIVQNPTTMDVWFSDGKTTHCVRSGETLHI